MAIFTNRWMRRWSPSWANANSDWAHWAGFINVVVITDVGEEPRSTDQSNYNGIN